MKKEEIINLLTEANISLALIDSIEGMRSMLCLISMVIEKALAGELSLDIEGEIWRPVVGFEGLYEVSNLGRVKGLVGKRGIGGGIKKQRINVTGGGYYMVNLSKKGKPKLAHTHMLVAETFIGPRPSGFFCCHNDGNPTNNHIDNLRWDTPQANSKDRAKHGTEHRGSLRINAKLNEQKVLEIRELLGTASLDKIAALYGVSRGVIVQVRDKRCWSHV